MISFLVFLAELFALGLMVCTLAMCLFVAIAWIEDSDLPNNRRPW